MSAGGFKNKQRQPFTMLANTMLRDKELSLKAKGLLALMLSFPDDWQYYMSHLEGLSKDGRESHQSSMKELIQAGYVVRQRAQVQETGRMAGWLYVVSDQRTTENGKTDRRETRQSGNPSDGKPATTNTDVTNTDLTKKKEIPRPPKPRAANPHFDAIVTALYPQEKLSNASHVAKVASKLKDAEWTPEDITHVLSAVTRDNFWKKKLTLGAFEKNAEDWRRRYGRARKEELRPAVVPADTTDDLDWTALG